MSQYIYRYVGFDTFVGMIQSKSLAFVLPEMWEDPQEISPFLQLLEKIDNAYIKLMLWACYYKTYGQCWTELSESDAMWRIYSYHCRAIRVKVSEDKVQLLDNVCAVKVHYTDDSYERQYTGINDYLAALTQKRTAFEHEKEIRLIHYYRFHDEDDMDIHVKALMTTTHNEKVVEIMETLYPNLDMEQQVLQVCQLLNIGKVKKPVKNISFEHIPEFISGVMVHPQAPDWYVAIVEEFCRVNNVPFEGKSKLYS